MPSPSPPRSRPSVRSSGGVTPRRLSPLPRPSRLSPLRPLRRYAPFIISGILLAAGALIPTRLGPVQRAWMGLAHAISRVTTPIFMAVIYFLVITPMGLLMRALGRNPLNRASVDGSFWVTRAPAEQRSDIERQF